MPASCAARTRVAAVLGTAALMLTACASGGSSAEPSWQPKPSFSGEGNNPGGNPSAQPGPSTGNSSPGTPSPSPSGSGDAAVVATNLRAPTGIAILPDHTALVGERATGRIVRVHPQPKQPVQTVRTLTGLSTAGGGGLLDLALSPNYTQDNLIFAYITTPTDNRVVDFTLKGPVTTVLKGIPRGKSDNAGRIAFSANGSLLIGTGDAGRPSAAADPKSLAGKVLRVSDIGAAAAGNPTPGSRVYASGFRRTDGLCVDPSTGSVFQTEARGSASSTDPINAVTAGGSYGWPRAKSSDRQPLGQLPATSRSPGGCAVMGDVLYTTTLDGRALLATAISASGGTLKLGTFSVSLRNKYGRLRTVVADTDGSLWLTTSNRDGSGKPVATDERVLHILPSGSSPKDSSV